MAESNTGATVPDLAKYITLEQLCAGLQLSEATARRRMNDGSIPFIRIGRLVRFPRELLGDRAAGAGQVVRGGKLVEVRG